MRNAQYPKTLHDFKDGNGSIPAHRHTLGGGWVANTAHVESSAYVGPQARVFGYAIIKDDAIITENAEVSGYAVIKNLACIKGEAIVRGSCTIMDHAEISGNVFIASNIKIGGHRILNKNQSSFNTKGCLTCPAVLEENYGGTSNNQCLYCIEKHNEHKNTIDDSRRSTIRSWLPKNGGINENIEGETGAPQKRGNDNK